MTKILPTLAAGVLLIYAIFTLMAKLYFNHESRNWTTVKAVVTTLSFPNKGAELEYKYEINGIEYFSRNISYLKSGTLEDRDIVKREVALGSQIKVYVDPRKADRSVFLRKSFNFNQIKLDLVLIVFCLIAMFVLGKKLLRTKGIERE